MAVEVKNLQSGETFEVGPDGATFGREGGPATIRVSDPSVSKRHARIFQDGNGWFVEDMGSVNGTVVDGGKISGPLGLRPGLIFQMSKQRFEVVTVDGRGPGRAPLAQPQPSGTEQETRTALRQGASNQLPSELRKDPIPKKKEKAPAPAPPRADYDDVPPPEPSIPSNPRTNVQPRNKAPSQLASDGDMPSDPYADPGPELPPPAQGGSDDYEDVGVGGAFFEGLAYLFKTAPSLVVNPLGTARHNIENAPLPAVEKLSLAALLAPTLATLVAVQAIGGALVPFIAGAGSVVGVIIALVVAVVGGAVSAVVSGFLGHPILAFVIDKLGGGADARGRTTHIAMSTVASTVLVSAMTLGALVVALTARLASKSPTFHLIVILPALLGVVAYPLPVLVQWAWFKAHGVAKWFQTLLLVFAILGVVAGVASAGASVWGGIQAMRGAANGALVPTTPTTPDANTGANLAAATDAGVVPTPDPTPTNVAPPSTEPTNVPPANVPPANVPPPPTPPPPEAPPSIPTPPPTATRGSSGYAEYARRRARIEAALEADPTLLNNPAVAEKYRKLSKQTYEAEKSAEEAGYVGEGRRRTRDPGLDAFVQKLKRAKAFEASGKTVDALYTALGEP